MIKKILILLTCMLSMITASAQIPYYSGSQGKGKTYTYFSTKFHPGLNNQQLYITVQHGLTDQVDLVSDATVGTGWGYQGFGLRFNVYKSKYLSIGGQSMVSFDLNDKYNFGYNCNSLYLTSYLNSNFHLVSNTWMTVYPKNTQWDQWTYVGYHVGKFTPMAGVISNVSDNWKSTLAVGTYYQLSKSSYLYVWGSNLTEDIPRIVLGVDYKF